MPVVWCLETAAHCCPMLSPQQLLARLLKSNHSEDLQAANRLIKSMIKEVGSSLGQKLCLQLGRVGGDLVVQFLTVVPLYLTSVVPATSLVLKGTPRGGSGNLAALSVSGELISVAPEEGRFSVFVIPKLQCGIILFCFPKICHCQEEQIFIPRSLYDRTLPL